MNKPSRWPRRKNSKPDPEFIASTSDSVREEALNTLRKGSEIQTPEIKRCERCGRRIKGRSSSDARFCRSDCARAAEGEVSQAELRRQVLERDRGICAECGMNCEDKASQLAALKTRAELAGVGILTQDFIDRGVYESAVHQLVRLGFPRGPVERGETLWQADHVEARVKGGPTTLDNARTLCLAHHAAATAGLARGRADSRRPRGRFGR